MGCWGNYDDECDSTSDILSDLEAEILPKKIMKLETAKAIPCNPPEKNCISFIDTEQTLENVKIRSEYMSSHKKCVQRQINKMGLEDSEYVGVCIHLARNWEMGDLPTSLPDDFPPGLRKGCSTRVKRMLRKMDDDESWVNKDRRIKCLNEELELFGDDDGGCVIS